MQLRHFAQLQPRCPVCVLAGRGPSPLALSNVARQVGDSVIEGILTCGNSLCQREHPIIDGVPVVVPDFRQWAQYQLDAVLRRRDLGASLESLLGDAAGPDSGFERDRSTLSTYAASHWGDHTTPSLPRERTTAAVASAAIELAADSLAGDWIDIGCSAGRATFELAGQVDGLVCGIDLNFEMLRLANTIQHTGEATYQHRRTGLVYEERQISAPRLQGSNVSFWCCDAGVLPFADSTFSGAFSLNVIDSVASPRAHLQEMRRVVESSGTAVVCTPYEWTPQATPVEEWIGGHSQRGPDGGSSESALRRLLTSEWTEGAGPAWAIEAERDGVPWFLSTHERSVVEYALHMLRLGPARR